MSSRKWGCSACTYENWPTCKKCVICLLPRQALIIEDEVNRLSINPESIDTATASAPNPGVIACPSEAKKWPCGACTYLNWPKSRKCVQCYVPRSRRNSPAQSPITSGRSSPQSSSLSTLGITISNVFQKWVCPACTLENWPRNSACVMCSTLRDPSDQSREPASSSGSDQASASASSQQLSTEEAWRLVRAGVTRKEWLWLNACRGSIEGDMEALEAYLLNGGSVNKKTTKQDCALLTSCQVNIGLEPGTTLARLAVRYQRHDVINFFLNKLEAKAMRSVGRKRLPCQLSPETAREIMNHVNINLRQRKGDFPCHFIVEHHTLALPAQIADLSTSSRELLFMEILDTEVQKELEVEDKAINWWVPTMGASSRLYALWNRKSGDCLLDSLLQATWGVMDREGCLRKALAESLREGEAGLFFRWREHEMARAAREGQYSLDEWQWRSDWTRLLTNASEPGEPLEELHIFTLCHILRRPVIVYGVKYINNGRAERIGLANFEGIYLPLLWERSFCSRNPLVIGYTKGHFSALLPIETRLGATAASSPATGETDFQKVRLPLNDREGRLLPVHFVMPEETRRLDSLLREWLDCSQTRRGHLIARIRLQKRQPLVDRMMEDWLEFYRELRTTSPGPSPSASPPEPVGSDCADETTDNYPCAKDP